MVKTLAPMAPFTAEDIFKHAHPSSTAATTGLFKTPWITTVRLTLIFTGMCIDQVVTFNRIPIGTNPI